VSSGVTATGRPPCPLTQPIFYFQLNRLISLVVLDLITAIDGERERRINRAAAGDDFGIADHCAASLSLVLVFWVFLYLQFDRNQRSVEFLQ